MDKSVIKPTCYSIPGVERFPYLNRLEGTLIFTIFNFELPENIVGFLKRGVYHQTMEVIGCVLFKNYRTAANIISALQDLSPKIGGCM